MSDGGVSFNAGLSAGAFLVGGKPRLSITPQASLNYRWESSVFVSLQDKVFLFPPSFNRDQFGFNNETSAQIGLMWQPLVLGVGLSFSEYSMVVCKPDLCGQVEGVAPGASLRAEFYGPWLSNSVGVAANASIVWYTGQAKVLHDDIALNAVVGPILRLGN